MKIRTDFVTNSSSSSFIVVFAKIDTDKAKSIIKDKHWEEYVVSGEEMACRTESRWFDLGSDWAGVWIDNPKKEDIDQSSSYFLLEECPGDDSDFYDEDGYDADYDINLDFFSNEIQEIYNTIDETHGFAEVQQGYGAGRNG